VSDATESPLGRNESHDNCNRNQSFHTKHYTDIHIGQWNKPYACTALAAAAAN
jgi:hypothetical protein